MKKRLLSVLLILCMVMTLLPAALAENADSLAEDSIQAGHTGPGGPYDNFAVENGVLTGYEGPAEDIRIPDGVTVIGSDVFADCESLMSVTIPESVTAVKKNAFANCMSLTDVYFDGDEAQWKAIVIDAGNERFASAAVHFNCAGEQSDTPPEAAEITGTQFSNLPDYTLELPELADLINAYIQMKNIRAGNIAIGYYNTVSGGQYLYNADEYYTAASIYKLPLNMYYYEMEAAGEISQSARFSGFALQQAHQQSLQYSNNSVSQAMRSNLGSYEHYKTLMAQYGGIPLEELPGYYFSGNYFNAAGILNTLKVLYDRQDFFSEAIQYLKDAHPGKYFETGVKDYECTIAQKYGYLISDRTYMHAAGIVYADEPFLLTVFTANVGYAENVLGDIARICYDYTQAKAGTWPKRVLNFDDVFEGDWYAKAVTYCVERNIIKGISDTSFGPNNALTRAMFVTMLGRFAGVNGAGTFADVNYGDYYSLYVEWAYRNGIAQGIDETHFGPNNPITREQAAVMLYRCLALQNLAPPAAGGSIEDFRDAGAISDNAKTAVDALHACGIFQGDDNGCFNPQKSFSRAETAVLFMKLDQYVENRQSPEGPATDPSLPEESETDPPPTE